MSNKNQSDENIKTGFVYHDIYPEHKTTAGHPESPQRLVAIIENLKAKGLYSELFLITPSPVQMQWLTKIHCPEYIERAGKSCEEDAGYLDSLDVPISSKSYESALMAAGGVLSAIDAVMEGKTRNAFCAVRPPGHHATEDRAMGFCIFNNIAIGTKYIQEKYGLSKILIVDWDVHHGNGTQADAHTDDPLGGMEVTEEGFAQMTQIVKDIAQKCCKSRLVSTLEGGYNLEALAASVEAHIRVLME